MTSSFVIPGLVGMPIHEVRDYVVAAVAGDKDIKWLKRVEKRLKNENVTILLM